MNGGELVAAPGVGGLFGVGGSPQPIGVAPQAQSNPYQMSAANYQNSGLGRFTSLQQYQPAPYIPRVFQPAQIGPPPIQSPSSGLLAPPLPQDPNGYGGGESAVGTGGGPGSGGVSVNGAGQAGNAIGTGLGMAMGLGPVSGFVGDALDAAAVSAASAANGPGPDAATDATSIGAVNGMDSQSDAADGSGGGGGGGK